MQLLRASLPPWIAHEQSRTSDGSVLSVLVHDFVAHSKPDDVSAAPELLRLEAEVATAGDDDGWASVLLSGQAVVVGGRDWTHVTAWANGRRLRVHDDGGDAPFTASGVVRVSAHEPLQIAVLLMAQRDIAMARSQASVWLDSIDLRVLEPREAEPPLQAGPSHSSSTAAVCAPSAGGARS